VSTREQFEPVLKELHGNFWKKVYSKLSRKMSALKSSLKKRSQENEVEFNITLDEIKKMFLKVYGKECHYCNKQLTFRNIACDHIVPLNKGGPSIRSNLQLICKTCNTRKGPLNEEDYCNIIDWVSKQKEEIRNYIMRKLAKGGRY